MDAFENRTEITAKAGSLVGDWAGAPQDKVVANVTQLRRDPETMLGDTHDLTNRLFDLLVEGGNSYSGNGYRSLGPASLVNIMLNPLSVFKHSDVLSKLMTLYMGAVYDSIDITVSMSNPKAMVGAAFVGVYPYFAWQGVSSLAALMTAQTLYPELRQQLYSGDQCELFTFAEAHDITFNVPWTFQQTYLHRDYLDISFGAIGSMLPGQPLLFFDTLSCKSVSTTTTTTQLRFMVKFNGLRFVAPIVAGSGPSMGPATIVTQKQGGKPSKATKAKVIPRLYDSDLDILYLIFSQGGKFYDIIVQFDDDIAEVVPIVSEIKGFNLSMDDNIDDNVSVGEGDHPGTFQIYICRNDSKYSTFALMPWKMDTNPYIFPAKVSTVYTQKQSGLEVAAAAAVADVAIAAGIEIVDTAVEGFSDMLIDEHESDGTYEKPTAVQMAYVGDSASTGVPPTTPIFSNYLKDTSTKHKVSDFLRRPQYIQAIQTGTEYKFQANPIFPIANDTTGKYCATWLRYFGMLNTYWRGTIFFDFVILGHPTVEVAHNLRIEYPPFVLAGKNVLGESLIERGVSTGVHRISVPMPFASQSDYMPILDNLQITLADWQQATPSQIAVKFDVINTMLDVTPTLDIFVFVRAGEDFRFYQPYAPGCNECVTSGLLNIANSIGNDPKKKDPNIVTQKQVGLPPVDDTFETRALSLNELNLFPTCENVEDYMKLWSRALPYDTLSLGEPYPNLEVGLTSPCWWTVDNPTAQGHGNNNSWYVTNDYVSYLSSIFVFYRGSIAAKVVCNVDANPRNYIYIALKSGVGARQKTHTPFTTDASSVPIEANFGNGVVITPGTLQPVLEITMPYRSLYAWRATNVISNYEKTPLAYGSNPAYGAWIDSNVQLQIQDSDLMDVLFRKVGPDFALAIPTLFPPPNLWMSRGYDWV
jgi:hypothetical protein